MLSRLALCAGVVLGVAAWMATAAPQSAAQAPRSDGTRTVGPPEQLILPKPLATPVVPKRSKVIGWPAGRTPSAPPGFQVSAYAEDMDVPRSLYVLPNGDVLVAENGRGLGSERRKKRRLKN